MISYSKKCTLALFLLLAPICLPAEQFAKKIHKPPVLTTSGIIELYDNGVFNGIVLIQRGNPPLGKALPGGKVEYGESIEDAFRREMREEVNLEMSDMKQFHVYSDPTRDKRFHAVEVTYIANATAQPTAGDDAAKVYVVKLDEIPWDELVFDHAQIIHDYLDFRNGNTQSSLLKP